MEVDKPIKSKNSESYNELAYCRLGHTNYSNIFRLSDNSEGLIVCKTKPTVGRNACEGYLAGKLKKSFIKKTDSRQLQLGRHIHTDISEILSPSVQGYKYYLLVIDDATRLV